MSGAANERGRARWIALLAVVALLAGFSAAAWLVRPVSSPGGGATPQESLDPAGESAAPDSAEIKSRWVDEVPGFDLSGLDGARREIFVRFANAQRCTCGCGYTLGACRGYDAVQGASYVGDLVEQHDELVAPQPRAGV